METVILTRLLLLEIKTTTPFYVSYLPETVMHLQLMHFACAGTSIIHTYFSPFLVLAVYFKR